MESAAPVSLPAENGTPPPPPSLSPPTPEENGSGGASSVHAEEGQSSGGDDGFESASELDVEGSTAAAPGEARPPVEPSSPIGGEDGNLSDDGENGSPRGVSIENPVSEENSKLGVVGAEEKVDPEAAAEVGLADGGVSGEESPTIDESVEAGPKNDVVHEVEENGVPDAGDEKDENLGGGGGGSEEAASHVIEGAAGSESVAMEPGAVVDAAGTEKNGVPDAQDEIDENFMEQAVLSNPVEVGSDAVEPAAGAEKNGISDARDEKHENSIEQAGVLKPVDVGSDAVEAVAGGGEGGVPVTLDENDKNLGVGSAEVASSVIERAADSKPLGEEPVAVEARQDEAANSSDSKQDLDGAVESNNVAVEAENDGEMESHTVEAESGVDANKTGAEDEDGAGCNGSEEVNASSAETLSLESFEPKIGAGVVENEESVDGPVTVGPKNAENSADKLHGVSSGEPAVGVRDEEKDENSSGYSVSMDSEMLKDSADKHDDVNVGKAVDGVAPMNQDVDKKVVSESDQSIEVQEAESSPILAEESKNREIESLQEVAATSADDGEKVGLVEAEEEEEGSVSDGPARVAILESTETAKQIIKEMEEGSTIASSHSGFRSSGDGQIVSDSDEEVDTDEEGEGSELFDSAALTALLKAATGASSDGGITITSQDASRIFSANRPAGLGSSVPALKPAPSRSSRPSPFTPSDLAVVGEPENNMDEEEKKLQDKVELIRVKFLRLVQRLGHSPEDTVAAQVLYRLGLAEGIRRGRQISRLFSIESAKKKALQLEEEGKEDLNFSCNILVLGKTGVGKSATINSIFGEGKSYTNPFEPATTSVREISGTVDGVKIRVLDTPGFKASVMDQAANRKTLLAIKKYTKRCPPDIVLYVDRMDTQTRDFNDLPLLRSITSILGSSIWFNAIVALTHAASAPPDGPNGTPLSYEVFVAQRSHVVQHSIRQAAGDMRLMNPIALVENHPSCRRNREGERVLPNGLSWRPQLMLLCYSSKILSEANALLKLQDPSPGKLFGFRVRSPPLPYLLSSLLQSRAHPKLSTDQGGENGDSDIDLDDLSDTEQEEEEDEYDQLPPFKPLRKSQISKLTKEQKRAYFDEYDYRVKLLQKKQWKEELRRLREIRKKGKSQQDDFAYGDMAEDFDQDGAPAAVPVPLPDMVLPPSFDCDNPVYRYRFLEPTSQLLIRPVLDSHGWDHDCGYDGVSIEENLAVVGRFPAGLAIQITKDKKEFNIHLDSSISAKHGESGSSLAGFDIQSIGKQLAYIIRSETKFKNLKKNKTAAGISVTFLGETVATGLKIEDQLSIGKRVSLVASTGAVRAQGDVAYGANLEARLRDKDYPIGQTLTTLGLSLMRWRSDLALGANLQSQFSIGRNSKMAVRVGLNNKLTGQITVRTSTSEQLQIALVGILPLAISLFRNIWPGESYMVN